MSDSFIFDSDDDDDADAAADDASASAVDDNDVDADYTSTGTDTGVAAANADAAAGGNASADDDDVDVDADGIAADTDALLMMMLMLLMLMLVLKMMRKVLELSSGLDDIGDIVWAPTLCLLTVYIICYFSLWKGIKGSGKVVWFTATFPYVVLFILLIRGVTLEGAGKGIRYYIVPKFESLLQAKVWFEAATQIFFSLGPGFGVLLTFASYNKFHDNVYRDAIVTSSINCFTSFISGLVVFATLGHMALRQRKEIEDLKGLEGPGLVFITYPEALSMMPGASFWSLLFFLMLITIGLDSSFGGSEAIITGISDQFPKTIKKHREIFIACLFTLYFLVGLAFMSQGGTYLFTLFDVFTIQYSIVFVVFCEAIAVSWFYGVERLCGDIKEMLGFHPGIFWRLCWTIISPAILMAIVIGGFVTFTPLELYGYVYPDWVMAIGWLIACSSMSCIPIVAIYKLVTTSGTISEKFMKNIKTPKQYPELPDRDGVLWYSPFVQNGTRI
ncbi:sodium-dependent dopamine transporter-like [Anneissia japonica]|uniref:sodium-dependent dopamine transporter-like n=1 Tax=Anneissia japonica TaxID=1529436 RepID=UPI001425B14B|nr:sodium-dependent dopamine transporter-like [Anneissia japonica]